MCSIKAAVHHDVEEEKGQVEDIEILLESLTLTIGQYEKHLQKKCWMTFVRGWIPLWLIGKMENSHNQ